MPPATDRTGSIRDAYLGRRAARQALADRQERIDRRTGDLRLAAFALALAAAAAAIATPLPIRAAAPFGLAFIALVLAHDPVRRRLDRTRRAVEFYARGLDRLDDRWAGTGSDGLRYLDPDHPCAADLDLFGPGSLFERLCLARTRAGEDEIAAWLLGGADADRIRERQAAIAELAPCLDLREEIHLLGTRERAGVDPAGLRAWAGTNPGPAGRGAHALVLLATLANVAAAAAWPALGAGPLPLLLTGLAGTAVARSLRRRVARALLDLESRARELTLLAGILERIERQSFDAPMLVRLRADLDTDGLPASRRIAGLVRLLHLLETGRNQFFAPFALLLLWRTRFAFAIERWRRDNGRAIGAWVDAAARFETLCSLAAWAAENPDAAFPSIVEGDALFDATGLGHPLLPIDSCVRNDVRLGDPVRVLVVSGSNMSGKSTLLRTVGCNAVLAFTGAPVRASALRISPLAPGATLRIQDSLREGRSRFYAEITRVRQVLDLTRGPLPVLFLFDEVFHGTNSSDRRIGARAVLESLVGSGAIGLATTHDLALADIADSLGAAAANVHFQDSLVDGEMLFDYRLRPGVVQHSNALALMRSVGLQV